MKGTSSHTRTWSRKVLLALTMVGALIALVLPIAPAGAADNNHAGGKITFCHRTNSATNPYVRITTDPASIVKRGHDLHLGPIFDAATMVSGDDWGDIIPSFEYSSTATGTGSFPGLNWTAEGEELCLGDGGGGGGDEVPVGSVAVEKTAATSLTRTHNWSIDKGVAPNPLKLYLNDPVKSAVWDVDVTYLGFTDSAWAVAGTVTTTNDGNVPAEIDSVDDGLDGSTVDCGENVVLPTTLAPGDSLVCDYTAPLSGADSGTNTARASGTYLFSQAEAPVATADDEPFEVTGSAVYDFTNPTVTQVNDTVTVTDNHAGFGLEYDATETTLDAADFQDPSVDPVTNFTYSQEFDRADYPMRGSTCVGETVNNRAAIVDANNVELGFDTASLDVQVQCLVVGPGETATGRGFRWNLTKKAASNWFMYTPWATTGAHTGMNPGPADIVAGQHHTIGTVTGSLNGTRQMTFALNEGWELKNVTNNVKVHPLSTCTASQITYVQPGGFSVKRTISPANSADFNVSSGLGTTAACYGIHLDVVRIIPDPNF